MRRIRAKDTGPELEVRRLVYKMGYRYRLHKEDLPGRPDLVFKSLRKIIFIHGCFWHQHQHPECKISHVPKSRTDYWLPKLQRTIERDIRHQEDLKKMGWDVLVIWECEVKNREALRKKVARFLSGND